jgi:hypothetical protein
MYGQAYNPLQSQSVDVPFEQPKSLFRFGEISLWSSYFFAGSSALANSTNRLFSVARGSTGQGFTRGLSIAETSLKEAGRVPSGVAYDVFGVACQIEKSSGADDTSTTVGSPIDTDATIGDLLNIQANGILSWDFTQTVVEICPVSLAGAGGGAFGSLAVADGGVSPAAITQVGHMNNGNGQVWMYRKHPVALPGNTTFAVNLAFGSRAAAVSTNGTVVRIVLLGYYKNIIEIG